MLSVKMATAKVLLIVFRFAKCNKNRLKNSEFCFTVVLINVKIYPNEINLPILLFAY